MFRPAALFIGLRYTRAKRRNHFISFISGASMVGISLGVAALITVLSVMNGFDREIKKRIFSMVPPLTISTVSGRLLEWPNLQNFLKQFPEVIASAPYINGEVLLNYSGGVEPALVYGILPEQEHNVSGVADKMVAGKMSDLKAGSFGIVLGQKLANLLYANVGDKVTVVSPQTTISAVGVIPRFKRFTVVGIFQAAGGEFDRTFAYINLTDAQKLFALGDEVNGMHVAVKQIFAAPQFAEMLKTRLAPTTTITTWADQFGEFFHAIQLEKTMMFLVLLLILIVAAFNMVSSLVMVVNEKEADIAILRTFGATPGMIMKVFIVQGGLVGLLGTFFGLLLGVVVALNVTEIVQWIEHVFHVQFMSSNVYFVNYLPSKIEITDLIKICAASLLLSLLATIYPAFRASKMDPVESLRYE